MLTTCTECGTRFRLNAEQLRQAKGQVRCSRCGEVFDAFVHLHGDDGTPWSLVPETAGTDVKSTQPLPPADTETFEAPSDATESLLGDTDDLPLNQPERIEPRIDDLFAALDKDTPAPRHLPEADAAPDATDELEREHSTPEPREDAELPPHDHLIPHPRQRRHRLLWALGSVVLALMLAAQLLSANRQALSRNPVIGPSLSALYRLLGHPLAAPRALDAWQIGNTNVTSDPNAPGGLSITGSLANNAAFSQPWPLLRVELTDRYGDVLRLRDFQPADYLPAAEAAHTPAPGTATHFRLDVVDPGPDAVGFQVAPCFDFSVGRVCAGNREHE